MGVWHTYSTRQTLSELETDKSRGLSGAEAERRLARWGPNRLEEGRRQGLLLRFLGQMKDPMILVLLAAARTLGGRVRRGCPKETCWFVLGGAFLLALVLPALLRLLPPWITPARWSDFSYWGGLLPAVGKAIETGFSLNPCAKDVLAKWNTLGLLIAATLANAAAGKLMLSRQQKNSTNL